MTEATENIRMPKSCFFLRQRKRRISIIAISAAREIRMNRPIFPGRSGERSGRISASINMHGLQT